MENKQSCSLSLVFGLEITSTRQKTKKLGVNQVSVASQKSHCFLITHIYSQYATQMLLENALPMNRLPDRHEEANKAPKQLDSGIFGAVCTTILSEAALCHHPGSTFPCLPVLWAACVCSTQLQQLLLIPSSIAAFTSCTHLPPGTAPLGWAEPGAALRCKIS